MEEQLQVLKNAHKSLRWLAANGNLAGNQSLLSQLLAAIEVEIEKIHGGQISAPNVPAAAKPYVPAADIMTFSKYKGWKFSDVPDDFCRWFMDQTWGEEKYPAFYKHCEARKLRAPKAFKSAEEDFYEDQDVPF